VPAAASSVHGAPATTSTHAPVDGLSFDVRAGEILGIAGARVVADELPVTRAHEKFDQHGRLLDAELFERLRGVVHTLASEAAVPESIAA